MTVYDTLPQMLAETGVALGMFDGLHLGHQTVIRAMTEACADHLIPAVFTFSGVRRTALQTQRQRDELLAGMGVQAVFQPEFEALRSFEPARFVREILRGRLNTRLAVCGGNFRFGKAASAGAGELWELCRENGMKCVIVPLLEVEGEADSSTRIRELVQAGVIPAANALLGRAFSFDFEVVAGNRLGRTIGWPTINQPFPEGFVRPRFGVYASSALMGGKWLPAVTNIGTKPTVGGSAALAETWIRDYAGDLYGQNVPVALHMFLRPERKFESLEALRAQIEIDGAQAAVYQQ